MREKEVILNVVPGFVIRIHTPSLQSFIENSILLTFFKTYFTVLSSISTK